MGIRLAMEAADRTAADYTWRERCVLMVFAMSAMDDTRECPPGIEDRPEIIRRLGLGRSQRYAVIASLVEKGALDHCERGRNGVRARYAIAPHATTPQGGRPGDPDGPPVDNPAKGPVNRDASASAKGPGSGTEGSRFAGLKGPGLRDPAPYTGIKGFKTGGKTPPPPADSRPLFPYALPGAEPGEGESSRGQNPNRERRALAAEIAALRPEWTARAVLRALEHPDVTGRPWPIVAGAMRAVAADAATDSPGRLRHPGPWWAEAARKARSATETGARARKAHAFDPDPESRLCRFCRGSQVDSSHVRGRTA